MTAPEDRVDISVIVATRGREKGCRRLARAVAAQFAKAPHLSWELLLVLDGCPVYGWVDAADMPIKSHQLPERLGIARARNAGISAAAGDLLAFLDDDCVPAHAWLTELQRLSRTYPDHVAFGGPVVGTDTGNLWSQLRAAVYYYETFGAWYVDQRAREDCLGAPYVNGGNSAYRRGPLVEADGFDPVLPAYSDVELGRRLHLQDKAVLSPGMAILHDHPSTFRAYMQRCWRSGAARGLLWTRRRYPQDAPGAVARAVITNIVWNNAAHRRRRVNAPPFQVVGALLCQEIVHGLGYAFTTLTGTRRGGDARGGVAATARRGGPPGRP
jgi:GT2 family glycosyltransferase